MYLVLGMFQDYGDDIGTSDKETDYVTKPPKVWSRELRNRFVISSGKRNPYGNSGGGNNLFSFVINYFIFVCVVEVQLNN